MSNYQSKKKTKKQKNPRPHEKYPKLKLKLNIFKEIFFRVEWVRSLNFTLSIGLWFAHRFRMVVWGLRTDNLPWELHRQHQSAIIIIIPYFLKFSVKILPILAVQAKIATSSWTLTYRIPLHGNLLSPPFLQNQKPRLFQESRPASHDNNTTPPPKKKKKTNPPSPSLWFTIAAYQSSKNNFIESNSQSYTASKSEGLHWMLSLEQPKCNML